jgi:Family of unknown function (DUF6174)
LSFVSPVTGRSNAVLATSQTADRNDQTVGSTGEPGKTESRLKLLDELAEAEATWVAQKPHAYQFTFRFACNGLIATPPPGYGLWLFEVNGEATRFAGVRPDMADYATVERQFAFIRKAVERRPFRVDVRYDPRRGYPTRVCVDPSVVTDDDFGFLITDFKILPNAGGRGSSPVDLAS